MSSKETIHFRALELSDLDLIYAIENDKSLWEVSDTRIPYSRETLKQYIASCVDIYTDKQLRLVLENNQKETLGLFDFFDFDAFHQRAGVGIIIQQKFRQQGWASKALSEMKAYAKETLGLVQLHCQIPVNNHASIQLFESNGFEQTGQLKNWMKSKNGTWLNVNQYQCKL